MLVLKLVIASIKLFEDVRTVWRCFNILCNRVFKYTEAWYVSVPIEEDIGRPGMGDMVDLCIFGNQ